MRQIQAPTLPHPNLHDEIDQLTAPLRELFAEHAALVAKASEVEEDIHAESVQAEIDSAKAASLGRSAPAASKRSHALVAESLEVQRALGIVASAIAGASGDLSDAVAQHGRRWASEIASGAHVQRTEAYLAALDHLASAELALQSSRGLQAYLEHGEPLQEVRHGRCWPLQRPSGEPSNVVEVLDALRRYGTQDAPPRAGRMRLANPSRSA